MELKKKYREFLNPVFKNKKCLNNLKPLPSESSRNAK